MTADRPQDRDRRTAEPARGRFVDASPAAPRATAPKAAAGAEHPVIPRQPDATSPRTAAEVPESPVRREPRPETAAGTARPPEPERTRGPGRTPRPEQTSGPGATARPERPQAPGRADGSFGGWLEPHRVEVLAAEWSAVQAGFVDDPAGAVEQADELVGRVADLVADAVRARREGLHAGQGSPAGTRSGTEELRLALRDYRSVLDRLLAS
ncbi:hypothetical protein [Kitasatospora sp. NPDC059571]|uniref:hypothetical protein n=1 Tax=Kitasatospora sp. NPDC059571 TaxID=3346871 RepID=UPI0036AF53CD